MIRTQPSTFLIIFFLLLFSGCHPLMCSWDFGYTQLTAAPPDSKLFGLYRLNDNSKSYLKEIGLNPETCSLKLNEDKSFTLTDAPSGIKDYNLPNAQLSKVGKWSVSYDRSNGCLIELEGLCVVPLSEKEGGIAIPITVGDGDECNGIVFVRESKYISSQKPIRLFDNHLPFEILSFTNTLNKNTTDTDTLKCNNWALTPKNIFEIIKNSKPIDGTTWDLNFLVLRCAKSVKILQSGQQYDIEINAAAFFSVSNGDTTVLFGDYARSDRKYFIEGPYKE